MAPNHIKAELMRRGIRQVHIAAKLGLARSTVNNVISGDRQSRRVQEAIASALGKPVHRVFPNSCVRARTAYKCSRAA